MDAIRADIHRHRRLCFGGWCLKKIFLGVTQDGASLADQRPRLVVPGDLAGRPLRHRRREGQAQQAGSLTRRAVRGATWVFA
jgi:hypothetical protein